MRLIRATVRTLCFLRLVGAHDTGRGGAVGLLPALHFRNELSGGGRWQSMHNDAADAVVSLLKPLMIRHTKAQRRDGAALLALPPCTFQTVVVAPAVWERAEYEAAITSAQTLPAHRLHADAQLLRGPLAVCRGLVGELGQRARRARDLGLMDRSLSGLGALVRRLLAARRLPTQRDDFRIGAEEV